MSEQLTADSPEPTLDRTFGTIEEAPVERDFIAELAERDQRIALAESQLTEAYDKFTADRVEHEKTVHTLTAERDRYRADLIAANRAECVRRIGHERYSNAIDILIGATIVAQSIDLTSAEGMDLLVETVRKAAGGLGPKPEPMPHVYVGEPNTTARFFIGPTLAIRK